MPYFAATRNANERPRLLQGMALCRHGQWNIDPLLQAGLAAGPDIARVQGRTFPNKSPALSVIAAGVDCGMATLSSKYDPIRSGEDLRRLHQGVRVLGALLPTLLMLAFGFRRFGDRYGASTLMCAAWIYALATPVASYIKLAYAHQLSAALSMIGALLMLRAWEPAALGGQRDGGKRLGLLGGFWGRIFSGSATTAFFGAFLSALSLSADYLAVVWLVPMLFALVELGKQRSWPAVGAAVLGAVLGALPLLWYHQHAFLSPWSTGYHHVVVADFADKHGQGFLGLVGPSLSQAYKHLLSPGGGLLWWAPLALLGAWGLVEMRNFDALRRESTFWLLAFGTGLLLGIALNFDGGWRVGPRYLLVAMPAVIPGLAQVLANWRDRPLRIAGFGALLFYSLVVNALAAALWPHFDLQHMHSPVAELLFPLWEQELSVHGVGYGLFSLPGVYAAVIVPVVVVYLAYGMLQSPGFRTWGAWVLAGFVGYAAIRTLPFWVPEHKDQARNLAYVLKVWEPRK